MDDPRTSTGDSAPSKLIRIVTPLVWAAFLVYFLVMLTQWLQPGYHIIDRTLGTVQVPNAWVIVSTQWDLLTFVGLCLAVLFIHAFTADLTGRRGALSVALMLGFVLGMVEFVFFSRSYLAILGLSGAGVFAVDLGAIATRTQSRPRSLVASILLWILLPIFAVAVLATMLWVIAGAGGTYPVQQGTSTVATTELGLLGLGYPIISLLVVVFLFSWVLRLALATKLHIEAWPCERAEAPAPPAPTGHSNRTWPLVLLAAAVALAIFVRVYAYLPAINPQSLRVGTDAIRGYACWLGLAAQGIPFNECVPSWWNLHIGALWFLQGINLFTGSADLTLKLAPAIWGILFDLTTYILVKEGTGDSLLAGVSALFSAVSLDTLVGIDAGILANWLALPVAFLFFAVVLRMFRTRKKLWLIPGFFLFIAMFLIHPWTWFLMAVVFAGWLAWDLLRGWRSRTLRQMKLEAVILASLIATGVIALVAEGFLSHLAGLYAGYQAAIQSVNLSNASNTLSNLQISLIQWVGGGETNPVWYVLGALGVLAIPSLRGRFARLLIVWLAAVAISVPLGDAGSLIQERVIFDIPLQIFAAIGAVWLARYLSQSLRADSLWRWRRHDLVLPLIVVTATLLSLGFDLEYIGFLFRV